MAGRCPWRVDRFRVVHAETNGAFQLRQLSALEYVRGEGEIRVESTRRRSTALGQNLIFVAAVLALVVLVGRAAERGSVSLRVSLTILAIVSVLLAIGLGDDNLESNGVVESREKGGR